MDKKTEKKRAFACTLRREPGLVLKGCWLPDTGLVHYSSSPPPCLSFTSLPQHHSPLNHFFLIQAGHLLNTPVTLSIPPSKALVCCRFSTLPLWCCCCHSHPTCAFMAFPLTTLQLQAQSQSWYVQQTFSRSCRDQNQKVNHENSAPCCQSNLSYFECRYQKKDY